jgi:hypothetical protein
MTAQKGLEHMHRDNADMARWNNARVAIARGIRCHGRQMQRVLTAAILCGFALTAVGCKTGTAFTKPSWWTFGGGKSDAGTLAAAPPYEGDIQKPSEIAKPYPTTSTPSGYVISGSSGAAGLAAQGQSPQPTAPVVYGTAPPAPALPPASTAALPSAPPVSGGPSVGGSSFGPQVGPYATLAGDTIPPPGQPLPPIGPSSMPAMPAETPLPGLATSAFPPAAAPPQAAAYDPATTRMADSRFSAPAAAVAAPAAAPGSPAAISPPVSAPLAAEPAGAGGSRYGSGSGSRFGGPAEATFPNSGYAAGPSASPASYGRPDEPLPATPAAPFSAPATPPTATPATPAGTPGLLQPSSPPVRRPDPAWRPGGTSSYRPSRSILADDAAPAADGVRTAAFEEPAAIRQ